MRVLPRSHRLQLSMSPSSSVFIVLPLLLPLLLPRGGAEDCVDGFRSGQRDFVLDAKASVRYGAALLGTVYAPSEDECKDMCCSQPRCNLALIEPRGTADAENRSCDMFNCIYRNQFVCTFVNQVGYLSFIREPVFQKYLGEPQRQGEFTETSFIKVLEGPDLQVRQTVSTSNLNLKNTIH